MGTENCSRNTGRVPSFPGNTKSKRDHSSFKLFCMGEPDRMILWGVVNCIMIGEMKCQFQVVTD